MKDLLRTQSFGKLIRSIFLNRMGGRGFSTCRAALPGPERPTFPQAGGCHSCGLKHRARRSKIFQLRSEADVSHNTLLVANSYICRIVDDAFQVHITQPGQNQINRYASARVSN